MIDISLFGSTEVHSHRGWETINGVKARRILEMLAVDLGSPVTKDTLAEGIWDGRPPASYVTSVESYVCVLRRGLAGEDGRTALVTTHGGYLLDPAQVRVDLVDVRDRLESVRAARPNVLVPGAEAVLTSMHGELLVDEPFADFANVARAQLDDVVEIIVTRAAEAALDAGDGGRALRMAGAVLARRALCEPSARVVMAARTCRAPGRRPSRRTLTSGPGCLRTWVWSRASAPMRCTSRYCRTASPLGRSSGTGRRSARWCDSFARSWRREPVPTPPPAPGWPACAWTRPDRPPEKACGLIGYAVTCTVPTLRVVVLVRTRRRRR